MPDPSGPSVPELVNALLSVSRVLVGVSVRCLVGGEGQVTLPQLRLLTVLATRGAQNATAVAAALGVSTSSGSRMCDRIARKGLIRRAQQQQDRRVACLVLTPAGRRLVAEVTRCRRDELTHLVQAISADSYAPLIDALAGLSAAAGQPTAPAWWLDWADLDLS